MNERENHAQKAITRVGGLETGNCISFSEPEERKTCLGLFSAKFLSYSPLFLIVAPLLTNLPHLIFIILNIGLIQVKEERWTGFSEGWQGCYEGFP